VIAPWREWDFRGRKDLLAYDREKGIETPAAGAILMTHLSRQAETLRSGLD